MDETRDEIKHAVDLITRHYGDFQKACVDDLNRVLHSASANAAQMSALDGTLTHNLNLHAEKIYRAFDELIPGIVPDSESTVITVEYFQHKVMNRMQSDVADIMRYAREFFLSVHSMLFSNIVTHIAAKQATLHNMTLPSLLFMDARGRHYKGEDHIRILANMSIYHALNQSTQYRLKSEGHSFAKVDYPGNKNHGKTLSLLGNVDYPTYDALKRSIFHPNSRALVVEI